MILILRLLPKTNAPREGLRVESYTKPAREDATDKRNANRRTSSSQNINSITRQANPVKNYAL